MDAGHHELLRLDLHGAFLDRRGISPADLNALAPRLERARVEVAETDAAMFRNPATIPREKKPLDAGFFELPERLLTDFEADANQSELGRILAVAARLRNVVDRVVVLGIGGSYMGARALMEGCCHPYHNELPSSGRSGPRMYFEGNNVDNDAARGLLDLLATSGGQPWAIVVISKSGGTLETAVALRLFLGALEAACRDFHWSLPELVVPVTGLESRLYKLGKELGCKTFFDVPEGVGGRFSVLSAVGLLPAALLGLDIERLLRGAQAMNHHFRTAPVAENLVLQLTGAYHRMETQRQATVRVLNVWSKSLEAVGLWYDQLLAESLGKPTFATGPGEPERGATPITAVNTRDLHSRAQQHQEGRFDKLHTNLIVDHVKTQPLVVPHSPRDQDQLNKLAGKTVPQIMSAALQGTKEAFRDGQRAMIDIHLPHVDEYTLGQLFQLLMLSVVVEGRLIDVNPYGQPGVEGYKKHMNRILGNA